MGVKIMGEIKIDSNIIVYIVAVLVILLIVAVYVPYETERRVENIIDNLDLEKDCDESDCSADESKYESMKAQYNNLCMSYQSDECGICIYKY